MVKIQCELSEDLAWALAQYLRVLGYEDYRRKAVNDDEALYMMSAVCEIQHALRNAGLYAC